MSFSIIIALGFLLMVSLGVNALVDVLSGRLERYFSEVSVIIFSGLNIVLVVAIITALFTIIFKVLPDGHLRWKECFIGAVFTSVLFLIGKFAISFYLGKSDLGATYGTSASIVILLTWIYYSSIILYFGAEFTKIYAKSDGVGITPNNHAVLVERKEAEKTSSVALEKEKAEDKGHDLLASVSKFVEDKFTLLRNEIEAAIAKLLTPAVYYVLLGIVVFAIIITLVLLSGYFLNLWLQSDYLGYVVLLGFFLVMISVSVLYQGKFREMIRQMLMPKEKANLKFVNTYSVWSDPFGITR